MAFSKQVMMIRVMVKYCKTKKFLPWAINITQHFSYPVEKMSINSAFLKFNQWAESNCTQYIDWYQNKINYRKTEKSTDNLSSFSFY